MPVDLVLVQTIALLTGRMGVFVALAPPFNHSAVPVRVRAMLGLALAAAVSARVPEGRELLGDGAFIMAMVAEVTTGALMALVVIIIFSAFQLAGSLIDTFGGFQIASAYDPGSGINGAQFTRFFHFAALVLMFASDAYQVIFTGLFRTIDVVPVGEFVNITGSASAMIDASANMLIAGAQIAAPLVLVLLLTDVGLGLVTRAAPALNAFILGFPLKMLVTICFVGLVFGLFPHILATLTQDAIEFMSKVVMGNG